MSDERLEQQSIRIEDMTMLECKQEHTENATEWTRRVESDSPPSSDEAFYHGRLQDMLYLKSINEQ